MKKLIQVFIIFGFVGLMCGSVNGQTLQDAKDLMEGEEYKQAFEILKPLAEKGNAEAQYNLGVLYYKGPRYNEKEELKGKGVPQDYDEAVKWWRLAAEQGVAQAQYELGRIYESDLVEVPGPEPEKEVVKWTRLAAEQGHAQAQSMLGFYYKNGLGVQKDYQEAVKWYRLAADQGDASAQNNLGGMYEKGLGVTQDYDEAVKWYRLAARQGHTRAKNSLGLMNEKGHGVPQDSKDQIQSASEKTFKDVGIAFRNGQTQIGLEILETLAEQGNGKAQITLGIMYTGLKKITEAWKVPSVEKNIPKMIKFLTLAEKNNDPEVKATLSELFNEHWLIEFGREFYKIEDYPAVFKLYSSSNRLNTKENANAQNIMGWMYANGKGVAKNEKEAMKWYKIAADHGSKGAEKALRKLTEELAEREKKAEAEARFKKWMDEAEQYRPTAKEVCEKEEKPSQCIAITSCMVAALISENPHDDRIKKFKKTAKGGLLSKGSIDKAMKELMKSFKEDESLEKKVDGILNVCMLGVLFH
jgi:TPR repeat protein